MSARVKDCADYAAELGWEVKPGFYPSQCCPSCHDDADAGWDELTEVEVPGTVELEGRVCCRVSEALAEARL